MNVAALITSTHCWARSSLCKFFFQCRKSMQLPISTEHSPRNPMHKEIHTKAVRERERLAYSTSNPTMSHTRETKNLVAVQSKSLDVSTVPIWHWRPGGFLEHRQLSVHVGRSKKIGSYVSGRMNLLKRMRSSRQRARESFFHILFLGYHQKVWPRFKVELLISSIKIEGLFTSSDQVKQTPHKYVQLLAL